MTSTIELLEAIGKDATLRHASTLDLDHALDDMGASDAMRRAAATGEARHLKVELNHKDNQAPQSPPGPPPGNCPPSPPPPPPPPKGKPHRGKHGKR